MNNNIIETLKVIAIAIIEAIAFIGDIVCDAIKEWSKNHVAEIMVGCMYLILGLFVFTTIMIEFNKLFQVLGI